MIDLAGKMVLPGLIDSHTHPSDASLTEFDHPVPEMETISDVLNYIRAARGGRRGLKWVIVRQVFITRLKEQRYPTRAELDRVCAREPGLVRNRARCLAQFARTEALRNRPQFSGGRRRARSRETRKPASRPASCATAARYIKEESPDKKPTEDDRDRRLIELLGDYNSVGITSIIDRDAYAPGDRSLRAAARSRLALRSGGDLARTSRRPATSTRSSPRSGRWQAIRFAAADRGCKSSESRPISTAACSPAAPTCASPGA